MPSVYILTPRSRLHLRSERLEVWAPAGRDEPPQKIQDLPLHDLERVILEEGGQITSEALSALLRAEIPVSLIGWNDRFLGGFLPPSNQHGLFRLHQYRQTLNPDFALAAARKLVQAKIHNQKRLLQRLAANRSLSAAGSSGFLQSVQNQVANVRNLEALRGLEGVAAAHYFGAWAGFLPEAFPFERRSTCPPHNAVNACISFGGSLLYNECATAIHARGLDPALGLLHATENGRWSLALDLMEPFRPVVVEALTMDLFSHGMLGEGAFEPRNGGVYLSHEGRRVFLPQYERRMEREFDSRHCGHRTTLRKQLAEAVSRLKAAFENPDRFEPFEMN